MLRNVEIRNKSLGFIDMYDQSNILFAYISGSLIEGFGNKKSDVDIYIITKEEGLLKKETSNPELILDTGSHMIHNTVIDGVRFDIEIYTLEKFEDILKKNNSITYNEGILSPWLSENEFDFLHRFKISIPLINEVKYEKYKENCDFTKMELFNTMQYLIEFGGLLEDLEGAISSKDYLTSSIMLDLLFTSSVQGYIASFGITNPKYKWIMKKMKYLTFKNNKLLDIFLKLKSVSHEDIEKNSSLFIEKLSICQSLNMETQKKLLKERVM